MSLIATAVKRRVTVAMATLGAVIFGFLAFTELPVTLLPDFSYPTLTVRTDYDGAAPAEVEALVTRPLEDALGVVRNLREMRSVSRAGQADVVLAFHWGTDMEMAGLDVRERLDTLNLPMEVGRPVLLRFDPSTDPVIRLSLSSGRTDSSGLRDLRSYAQEQLKRQLEVLEGVAAVSIGGGLEEEVEIRLDAQRMAELGIASSEVVARLRAEHVNLSGGVLREGDRRYLVRTLNEFPSVEAFSGLIIARRDDSNIELGDIADVVSGAREREAIIRQAGNEAVEIAIYKEGDANTVSVARTINNALPGVRRDLPGRYQLELIDDQSLFIRQAIQEVIVAGLLGGLFAVLVLYLFLGQGWATLAISLAIPISVISSFFLMRQAGVGLNIMSLGGLALAIGLLVDNAIVVLENIARHHREQSRRLSDAVVIGTQEMAPAVTASTLTTIAVFLPLVFVEGIAGQLFRDQALTVTFALLVSLAVALTLIPMLASLGEKPRARASGDLPPAPASGAGAVATTGRLARFRAGLARLITGLSVFIVSLLARLVGAVAWLMNRLFRPLVRVFNRGFSLLADAYPRLLERALAWRAATVAVALGLFALALVLLPRLGAELVPSLAQGEFHVEVQLAPGTPLEQTDQLIARLDQRVRAQPGVARTDAVAGTGSRMDTNPEEAGEHSGTLNVVLEPGADEAAVVADIRRYLAGLPGVQFTIGRPELFTFATPLEIEVSGFDLDQLRSVTEQIVEALSDSPRFADVQTTVEQGHPEIQIRFDHERAARLGLRADQIADTVVRQVRGEVATRYTWRERRIDVLVRARDDQRDSLERLAQMVVNPGSERPVTLDAVADLSLAIGPSEIRRVSQQRVALIRANPGFGDLGRAADEAREILAGVPLPSGMTARVAGQSDEMARAFTSLVLALALAVFLVYLVMASQFESLLHPFVILLTVPLALTGAVFALWLSGSSLSVVVFIGLIMLVGIVVNNAIVLVTRINQLREDGLVRQAAIIEAGRARLRPIIMTTLTTTLGLLPLALGLGEGAEMRAPMALTVIGGLLLATLLTLFVIPVVYSLLDRRQTEADLALATRQAGPA